MNEVKWWWLSFDDEVKGFLGACIIPAQSFLEAVAITSTLDCNPGGEILCNQIDPISMRKITLYDALRILNKAEARALVRIIDDESI